MELGFADEHYFCTRLFTRIVGEPPSAFRDRVRAFSSEQRQFCPNEGTFFLRKGCAKSDIAF